MMTLPLYLMELIFSHLSIESLLLFRLTNRSNHRLITKYLTQTYLPVQIIVESLERSYPEKVSNRTMFTKRVRLTPQVLTKYYHTWNWKHLSLNPSLTPEMIDQYKDHWDWKKLSQNRSLTLEIIAKYEDKWDWSALSKNLSLTLEIIERYEDRWDWSMIGKNYTLTPEIIDAYGDRLVWNQVTVYHKLSINIIRKYRDKVDWSMISRRMCLSWIDVMDNLDLPWDFEGLMENIHLTLFR